VSYTDGNWRHGLIESRADLQSAWPLTDPANCDQGAWQGWTPTLMLTAMGDPLVAYDAVYVARCSGDQTPNDVLQRAARLVNFIQP
jgi:hypothetical protein